MDLVTQTLLNMAASEDTYIIECKRKAVTAFFPYAVWRERVGDSRMMDAFLTAAKVFGSKTSLWYPIVPFIPTLFGAATSQTVVETSPYVPWDRVLDDPSVVAVWAEATTAVPDTEEVNRRVVDALLQIASVDFLRPHVPDDTWSWLNKRPTLPAECIGRSIGTKKHTVRRIRQLRDVETLKSYFLLVWSEWNLIGEESGGFAEMLTSIHEDFGGIGMGRHREDLIKQLDDTLTWLNRCLGTSALIDPTSPNAEIRFAMERYGELKRALAELDRDAAKILTRASPRLIIFGLLTPVDTYRIPLDLHVHLTSPRSVVSHLGTIALLPPTNHNVVCTIINSYRHYRVSFPSPFV